MSQSSSRPIVAITMGDPAGIGPEIVMRSLAYAEVHQFCRPLVIGDAGRLRKAGVVVGSDLVLNLVSTPAEARFKPGIVDVIDLGLVPDNLPFGAVSPIGGEAAYRFIERACALVSAGAADAICTAPISKEALHAAGHRYPGHTELLAHLTGTPEVSMMLTAPKLRVIHVTTHIGLLDAINRIEPGLVERTIGRGHATLVKAGIVQPKIGVCAINPHAGENGLFGDEEIRIVGPAVAAMKEQGVDVYGPCPPDTVYMQCNEGMYDMVVAMYHDQGHIPLKLLGFYDGVNITAGLPFIRTSADHGTAFDIAWTGKAKSESMAVSIKLAMQLA